MSSPTVGSVSVDVVPDARGFAPKLARQITPEAAAIGREFGKLFGQQAQRQMAEGVQEGLREGGQRASEQGTRTGRTYGSAVKRAVKAETSDLAVEIDADIRGAQEKVKRLREYAEKKLQIDADVAKLQQKLATLEGRKLKIAADTRDAETKLTKLQGDAEKATGDRKIKVDADIAQVQAKLRELSSSRVAIDADTTLAQSKLDALQGRIAEATNDKTIDVDANIAAAEARLASLQSRRVEIEADVDLDTAAASAQLALLQGQAAGATGAMGGLLAAALLLGPALIPIGAVAVGAMGAIATGALAAAGGIGVLVLALAPVIAAVQAVQAAEEQTAQSSRGMTTAHLQMASAMDAVANAQAGLKSAIQDAADAQVRSSEAIADARRALADAERQAAQDRVRAERDVADAQEALADVQRDSARRVADAERAYADQRLEDAERIADAKQRLADAQEDAARDEIAAIRRIQSASRALAKATQDAADDQVRAQERIVDASRGVEAAKKSELRAERALADARKAAAQDAEDLANAVIGGQLDERGAILRVQEAQEELQRVMKDRKASELERQQAQLTLDEAIQGLKERQLENQRLAEEKAKSDAEGIEGSKRVQDAQDAVRESQQQLVDAQKEVARAIQDAARQQQEAAQRVEEAERNMADAREAAALQAEESARVQREAQEGIAEAMSDAARAQADAQQDIADAVTQAGKAQVDAQERLADAVEASVERRREGARSIADAERGVTQAQRDAEIQQRKSAESIASAQQAVVAAQRGVQQASQSAGATGGAAMDKVREKMAALTPEGQRFVTFLTDELFPMFSGLSDAAQAGFLPGLQRGLEALKPLIPGLTGFVGALATTMGDLAEQAGKALGGPFWRDFFSYVGSIGPDLLGQIGRIVGDLVTGFAGLIQAFDPVTRMFFDGLEGMTQAFSDFGRNATQSSGFQSFITYIQQIGPQVVGTFQAIAGAVGAILSALAPLGPIVLTVVTGFANLIASIPPPILAGIVIGIGALAAAMAILNTGLAITNALLLANPIVLIVGGIIVALTAVAAGLFVFYQRNEEFRANVQRVWEAVSGFIRNAWTNVIRPVFAAIWGFIRDTLIPAFQKYLVPAVKIAFEAVRTAISLAWGIIRGIFTTLIRTVREELGPVFTWLWRNVVGPAWTGIRLNIELAWGLIKVTLAAIKLFIEEVLAPVFTWLWKNVVKPAWDGIYGVVRAVWRDYLKPLFETIGGFIEKNVAPAFGRGVEAIKTAWDKIKDAAKAPVKFVIERVINDGIIGGFNKIAGVFKVDPIEKIKLPEGFATGGYISGPGGPREDKIPAMLSNGEYVIQASAVRRLGRSFLDYLNNGGSIGGDPSGIAKFAKGGMVERVERVLRWLPSVDALPYVWAAVGPSSYDCSGLTGEVYNRLLNRASYQRAFTTSADFGKLGFAPGQGLYTIGVDAGTHMAGNLAGLPFEAASSRSGIHVGARARSVTSFPQTYYLKDFAGSKDGGGFDWSNPLDGVGNIFGGVLDGLDRFTDSAWGQLVAAVPKALVEAGKDFIGEAVNPFRDGGFVEPKKYDSGGYIPPGLTTVYNATGKPEPVFNPAQWDLIRQGMDGGGGQPVHVVQHISNPAPETAGDSLAMGMRKIALYGLVGKRA